MNKPPSKTEYQAENSSNGAATYGKSCKSKKFKDRITPLQLFFLTFLFIFSGAVLHNTSYNSGRGAFISALATALCGILLSLIYYFAAKKHFSNKKYSQKNSAEIFTSTPSGFTNWLCASFGRVVGSFFSLLYMLFFVFRASYGIKAIGEYSGISLLPEITPLIISLVVLIFGAFMAYSGLTAAGRLAEVSSVFAVFALVLLLLGFFNIFGFSPIFAVSDISHKTAFSSALSSFTDIFCDIAAFLCVFGKVIPRISVNASQYANAEAENTKSEDINSKSISVTNEKKEKKYVYFGVFPAAVISAAVIFVLVTLRDILIFGPTLLSKLNFPSAEAVRLLGVSDFRPFFDFCLVILYSIRIGILLFAAFFTFYELFLCSTKKSGSISTNIRARRITACVSVIILIASALAFGYFCKSPAANELLVEISFSNIIPTLNFAFSILLSFIIPLLMLILGMLLRRNT